MGSVLACCACQAFSCCMSSAVECCGKMVSASSIAVRIVWAVLLLFVAIASWVMSNISYWIKNSTWLSALASFQSCPKEICYSTMATYRVCFSASVFFALFAVIMIGVKKRSDFRGMLQDGWWMLKIPVLLALTIGSFWIPNVVFVYYGYIALAGAGLFIILQLILLVDFAHSWNENWVSKYNETESKGWLAALLTCSVLLYILSLIGTGLMYAFFTKESKDCWYNTMFVTLNLILCFAFTVFSIHPKLQEKNQNSGLLQSAVVTAYSTYLIWSAISSEPPEMGCSSLFNNTSTNGNGSTATPASTASLVIGLILTFVAVIYSALTTSSSNLTGENQSLINPTADKKSEEGKSVMSTNKQLVEEGEGEDEDEPYPYNITFFHVTFCLATMYLAMVLTNWGLVTQQDDETKNSLSVDQGIAAVWVKVVSSWITIGLYIWSLLAPIIFPDRVFT
eukprot:TRINITY_DN10464_c0_g1_i1.p1 TRINITY_DN10464_c0_g1~~TRINITY_DN10464_c0_g1_i1.p1  ORF type:complete len:452 (-),score=77.54 TRINITY_DN10464_c0_g1_i1:122-1477(-)